MRGPFSSPARPRRAQRPIDTVTLDWAYYNPVSLVLKQEGWLEEELEEDGIEVRWVQSLGSNKALEFLNAGSHRFRLDRGGRGAARQDQRQPDPDRLGLLQARVDGAGHPPDTGIAKVEDLKGKRIAVTKGTDPYIFLLRALDQHGLGAGDVDLVLLQHDQGRPRWSAATSTPGPGSTR